MRFIKHLERMEALLNFSKTAATWWGRLLHLVSWPLLLGYMCILWATAVVMLVLYVVVFVPVEFVICGKGRGR